MYYCLIASLEQYSLSTNPRSIDFEAVRGEIFAELSPKDYAVVELLYAYYDILNILGRLTGRDVPHNPLGNLTAEQIDAEIEATNEADGDQEFISKLPVSIHLALQRAQGKVEDDDDEQQHYGTAAEPHAVEELLLSNFYVACAQSSSKFLKCWAEADRKIREICASDAQGDDMKEERWWAELQSVLSTADFVEREHKMDALRWNLSAELLEPGGIDGITHDFDLAAVLNYLVELNILQRWATLSKEVGRERFESMVGGFTSKGKIEI